MGHNLNMGHDFLDSGEDKYCRNEPNYLCTRRGGIMDYGQVCNLPSLIRIYYKRIHNVFYRRQEYGHAVQMKNLLLIMHNAQILSA